MGRKSKKKEIVKGVVKKENQEKEKKMRCRGKKKYMKEGMH